MIQTIKHKIDDITTRIAMKQIDHFLFSTVKQNHKTIMKQAHDLKEKDRIINELLHERAKKLDIIENMTFTIESLKAEYGVE